MIDSYFSNIENLLNNCDFIERIEINKQKINDSIVFRYDNMPHHPHLSSFPHHKHIKNKIIKSQEPELILIIKEIKDFKSED